MSHPPIPMPKDYTVLTQPQRRALREAYVIAQEGRCYHCKEPLSGPPAARILAARINWSLFPPHFLAHPVHLHHCHETNLTIGAVHAHCNAHLWCYHNE